MAKRKRVSFAPRRTKRTRRRLFRGRRRRRRSRFPRPLIPKKTLKTFKYSTSFDLNPGANIPATRTWSANGLYDPDVDQSGHQPLGFDQYIGILYDHYVVIGAKCTVTFSSTSGSTENGTYRVGIALRDTSGYSGDVDTLLEQGRCKYKTVSALTSNNKAIVSYSVKPHKYLGISSPLSSQELKGSVSSNPTEQAYFVAFAAGNDIATDQPVVKCTMMMTFTAILIEPRMLGGS